MASLVLQDTKKLIKSKFRSFAFTTILVGLLFFVFDLIFGLTISADKIDKIAAKNVGIYFYINDTENKDDTYTRIISMKEELNKVGVDVQFSSKDDAFAYLEKKVPALTNNFEKFGIENPLPSTLYVMFSSPKEYEKMKEIIVKNKDLIMNVKDVDKGTTLVQQENRSLRVLKVLRGIRIIGRVFSGVITITILTFMMHLLNTYFYSYSKEVEIKKLLGSSYWDANEGFLLVLKIMMVFGIAIGALFAFVTYSIMDYYLGGLNINLGLKYTAFWSIIPGTLLCFIGILLGYHKLNLIEKEL